MFQSAKKWLLSRSRAVGLLRLRESRFSEAVRVLKMVVTLGERISSDRDKISDLISLGVAHQALGQQEEAEALFEKVIVLSEKVSASVGPADSLPTMIAADLLADRGRFDQAELLLHRGILRAQEEEGEDCRLAQIYLGRLASAYVKQDLHQAAEEIYQRLVGMAERTEPGSKNAASALNSLAWHLTNQDKVERAALLFRQALHLLEKLPPDKDFGRISTEVATLHGIATLERQHGHHDRAAQYYCRAIEALEKLAEPNQDYLARLLESLAAMLKAAGRDEEAAIIERRVTALRETVSGMPKKR